MEVSAIKNRKLIEKNQETQSWFFKNINKINKLFAGLTKTVRRLKLLKSEVKEETLLQTLQKYKVL